MNTNQDTTLTNQDEAFNKYWHIEMLTQSLPSGADKVAERAYQAATKASEQRIQTLEYLIDLDTELHENSAKTILELQAHVNKLHEALKSAWSYTHTNEKLMNSITSLLYSTHAQSLAEHDNELLDKVIRILSDNGIYHDGAIGKDILKLKVTP